MEFASWPHLYRACCWASYLTIPQFSIPESLAGELNVKSESVNHTGSCLEPSVSYVLSSVYYYNYCHEWLSKMKSLRL